MKRLLMYSQDGMGLGHLRRSSNIAKAVLAENPDCDVLIVADSPATSLFSYQQGIEFLKLPTVVKTGATSWVVPNLSLDTERIIRLRAKTILQAFDGFDPDTVLIDHMPVGALGELKPMLDRATLRRRPPRLFLGLRDVLDDPAVIRRVWSDLGAYEYLPKYESVLIYGSRQIYDAAAAYRLVPGARSVVYCGYVAPRSSPKVNERCPDGAFVLMMGGGGGDAFPLADTFVEAFPKLSRELGMPGVLLTGPSMSETDRRALRARASSCVQIESGFGHATGWVKQASAVLTMGGYNSLCELLRWRKKGLVVPRPGPSAEQQIRTRLFSERSLIRVLAPGSLEPVKLTRALTDLIAEDGVPDPAGLPPIDGAERSAALLLGRETTAGDRAAPGRRRRRPCRAPLMPVLRERAGVTGRVGGRAAVHNGNGARNPHGAEPQPRPTEDLPLLEAVLDPEEMGPRLGELLAPGARNGWAPRLAKPALIAYRRGRRALIAYDVGLPSRDERVRVFGKHFADPARARRVWGTHLALHRSCPPRGFSVAQPLDWIPELALVLYRPAVGRSFIGAVRARDAGRSLRLAAGSLAGFHSCGLSLDRRFMLAKELDNLAIWAELACAEHPDQEGPAMEVLDRLRELAPQIGFELDVPIHKDFHYEHLVLGSTLGILDVDEARFGDPSFDLAHFCTYLELLALRTYGLPELAEALERAFLEEYARQTGWTRDERFAYFRVYTYLKIAKQLCTIEGVAPRPTGMEQRRQVGKVLKRARALIATVV
jgi:predicted glycosyltransferase